MKSYTDLEQSKKLAEILPIESADMCWTYDFDTECFTIKMYPYSRLVIPKYADSKITNPIPAWSLLALLDVLPNNEHIETSISRGSWQIHPVKYLPNIWWCEYEDTKNQIEFNISADNQVDACVEMILKLKEKKLL